MRDHRAGAGGVVARLRNEASCAESVAFLVREGVAEDGGGVSQMRNGSGGAERFVSQLRDGAGRGDGRSVVLCDGAESAG